MARPNVGTVVSLTPMRLARDTRTLKMAGSFARFGYRSVVVENVASRAPGGFAPVEVVSFGLVRRNDVTRPRGPHADVGLAAGGARAGHRPTRRGPLAEALHLAAFLVFYLVIRPIEGVVRVPAARLYYLHEYRLYPLVWLIRLFRGHAPYVYDVHDFYPQVFAEDRLSSFWRRFFRPVLAAMERRCTADAAAVVTVCDGVAELFEAEYGVRPEVIRNCHDRRLERPAATSIRDDLGIGPDDFLIAVIGNRKPGQAVDAFLEALRATPANVKVAFVGLFHEPTAAKAAELGIETRVFTPGAREPEEIVSYVGTADVAASPYFAETDNVRHILPNGFFQSLSAGLPLLYPDLPEIRRIVAGYAPGRCIRADDSASVAAEITWMLENEGALKDCRAESLRLARAVSWENEERKLRALVDRLVGNAGKASV